MQDKNNTWGRSDNSGHILNKLSDLGQNLQGSEIRRLFATSMRPNVISLAGGLPAPEAFPVKEFADAVHKLVENKGKVLLQYGSSKGSEEGINAALYLMDRRNIKSNPNQIVMTSGAQQVINLCAHVFVDPGDIILAENPTFVGALGVFRNAKAQILGVPMDDDGMITDELEKTLKQNTLDSQKIKFLYTIPNFQNPTGRTLSLKRRYKLLELAEKYDFLILEDDPYGELWFEGGLQSVTPLKALDQNNRVIYAGSFSKVLSPGIRLGWACADSALIDRFDMAKQMMDVCPNPLIQAVAYTLCDNGTIEDHITHLRDIYKIRFDKMQSSLERYMPPDVSWTIPRGGFYIWLKLPDSVDALDLLSKALKHDVAFVIGNAFSPDATANHELRLSFCHESLDHIDKGIERLATALSGEMK